MNRSFRHCKGGKMGRQGGVCKMKLLPGIRGCILTDLG